VVWIVVSYFPVSNIPVVLPTVRAERFWYFPAIGSCMLLAILFAKLVGAAKNARAEAGAAAFIGLFALFQCFAARWHAFDYKNDLAFWDATRKAVPNSAKAHLNYSVMLGARGDLDGRLVSNGVALRLAPEWPMASIYEGDTLCRLHRAPEAVPYYLRGFELGPNDQSLIALGLQCLWDEKLLQDDQDLRDRLSEAGDKNPGSWLKYLVDDTLDNGEENKGVSPKYRPRGYNEGPKKDE
jgi:protein O-mannosyl-transferase